MRRRVNDNFYARPENVKKREVFWAERNYIQGCGVKSIKDKPWYCGESELCCEICKRHYSKNKFCRKEVGV